MWSSVDGLCLAAGCWCSETSGVCTKVRAKVPGVLGMNILSHCHQGLFGQHSTALFDLPAVLKVPSSFFQVLQDCHQVDTQPV